MTNTNSLIFGFCALVLIRSFFLMPWTDKSTLKLNNLVARRDMENNWLRMKRSIAAGNLMRKMNGQTSFSAIEVEG